MTENAAPTQLLCVDDDANVLRVLSLHLSRGFEVFAAASGRAALEQLRLHPAIAVVVTDLRMPGMDGAEFLGKAREIAPDIVAIVLTGTSDVSAAAAAVNDGQVFRFLVKPCPAAPMMAAARAAAEHHRLVIDNRTLLERERMLLEETLHGSIRTLGDVLALANPMAFGHAMRVKEHVSEIAGVLELTERWQFDVAAMLSQIGAIALPPETAHKVYYGKPLTPDEQEMVARVPAVTDQLLSHIPGLETVRAIIAAYAQPGHLRLASPEPERVAAGVALLRVAAEFDALETAGTPADVALDLMLGRAGKYDDTVLRAFETVRRAHEQRDEIREVRLEDLREGMILGHDVLLRSGMLLAGRGYQVTSSFVERARNFRDSVMQQTVRVVLPR